MEDIFAQSIALAALAKASSGGGGSVDAYTKAQTDALLADKADKINTLTSWKGTAAQYAQLQTDDYDLYFIEEAESP